MNVIEWETGDVQAYPENGELYVLDDLGRKHTVSAFGVGHKFISGQVMPEWHSKIYTSGGVYLSGIFDDPDLARLQMDADIESMRVK